MMTARPDALVISSTIHHVYALAHTMRRNDVLEVEALGMTPALCLRKCYDRAIVKQTLLYDGEVAAMYGLLGSLIGGEYFPYLLTAECIERDPVTMIRIAKQTLLDWQRVFGPLSGYVAAEYDGACDFLARLGFKLGEPFNLATGIPFREYHIGAL